MRFLMVCTFYPPFSFGGDAISVQEWSRALVRLGHEVTVVHDVDAFGVLHHGALPPTPDEDDEDGIRVIHLRSSWRGISALLVQQLGRPVLHARRLRALVQGGGFDAVVYHNPSLIGAPGMLSWPTDATTVYMAREHWLVCPMHVLLRNKKEPCEQRSCLRCTLVYRRPPQLWRYTGAMARGLAGVDLLIALSEFSRTKHREGGITRAIEVLPNFVPDLGSARDAPGAVSPPDRPYFFFAGRLERIKGLDDVIPLFRSLDGVDLLIAGEGEHGAELRELARGMSNVRFLGQLDRPAMHRYYRGALATLAPSMGYEAFSRVLIESMQAGVPFVARRIGPAPETAALSGAGLLFASPDELRLILVRLASDRPLRDRLASNAIPAVLAHWSEGVVVPRFITLVQEASARPRLRSVGSVPPQHS